jgi:hypothetical protein
MKIALSMLIVGLATMSVASTVVTPEDEEAQLGIAHHNIVFKYNMMATLDVLNKFGQALRVATWLKECKLDALANTVSPTNEQIRNVVVEYLRKQSDGKQYLWDVLAGVTSSVNYYQIGFKETVGPIRSTMREGFCSEATRQANNLLRQRQSESTPTNP